MAGTGINLGAAFVDVVPSARGIQGKLSSAMSAPAAAVGRSSGRTWGQKFGTAVKVGAGVAAGGAAALVGTALVKGFKRLSAIETATAKLKGLGNSSKDVGVIMDGALKAVKGTAFGMDAAATSAAGAVAAGIKPGKQLNGVLKSMANSAAAAGVPMEEMGSIYNKVASLGKAQNDSLQQVADKGIPIYQALGDQLGVTSDEVFKMASKGKIDFAMFEKAMKTASGTVAKEMGTTTMGTFENLNAAMGRLGAGLLAGTFPKIQPLLGAMIGVVDKLTEAAGPAAEAVGKKLAPALDMVTKWLGELKFDSWSAFTKSLGGGGVSASMTELWGSVKKLAPVFGDLFISVQQSAPAIAKLARGGVDILSGALKFLADHMDTIVKWMPLIVTGIVAWQAATALQTKAMAFQAPIMAVSNGLRLSASIIEWQSARAKAAGTAATVTQTTAENAGLLTKVRSVAATIAQKTATIATSVATRAAAAGQWLLNAAMSANPIGLIILGITALVAGLVWFFTQTKLGQAIIAGAWAGIKVAIGAVAGWFTGSVVPFFRTAIGNIVLGFQIFKAAATVAWTGFRVVLGAVWSWVKAYVFTPLRNFVMVAIPAAFNFLVSAVRIYIAAWRLVISTAWNFVRDRVFTPLKNFVTITIPAAFTLFKNLIHARMENFRASILNKYAWVKVNVFGPLKNFVTVTIPAAFTLFKNLVAARMANFRSGIHSAYAWVRDHTFSPLQTLIKTTIPNAFNTGVKAIGNFWNKLKSLAGKPVNFVIDTIYNKGIRSLWNPIAGLIGKDKWKLDKVNPVKLRSGGKVWGPGTETSDSVPARLSRNEHVLSAKDVKNLGGHGNVYRLRAAAAHGWTPGLATGGTLQDAARWLQGKGVRITEFKPWGQNVGGHAHNSQHYTGNAFDANAGPGGQNATEQGIFDRLVPQLLSKFPGLKVLWRVPGHFNHLHVGTGAGGKVGTGGPGGGSLMDMIPGLDKLRDLKDKLSNMDGGRFGDAIGGLGKKAISGLVDKAQSMADWAGGVVDDVKGGITKGVAYGKGQTWATLRGLNWSQRKAMNYIVSHESGWDPKAKNPRSTASGLPQMINSTARDMLGGAPASKFGVFDQLDGMKKYVNKYGGWEGAMRHWMTHHSYATGGAVLPSSLSMMSGRMPKPTLFDSGGRLTDRMVAIHGKSKPDAVLTDSQWNDMHNIAMSSGSGQGRGDVNLYISFNGDIDSKSTADKVVRDLSFEVNRLMSGGRYVGI